MRKPTIVVFWVAGLLFSVISVALALQIPLQELQAPVSLQSPVVIPGFLFLIAGVANLIAWIGALVLAGRIGAWAWFVGVLLLGSIGLLGFLLFGPDLDIDDDNFSGYGSSGAPI